MNQEPLSPDTARVVPFPTRRRVQPVPTPPPAPPEAAETAEGDRDEYRHRMKMNLATLVIVMALVGCGLWLADRIAQLRKVQDCVVSGRTTCATIPVPEDKR